MENLNMMAFTTISSSPQTKRNIQQLPAKREGYIERGICRVKCPQNFLIYYIIPFLVISCWLPDFIVALKDVSVTIPQAVKRGSNAMLTCNYDMENDTLYSVKWYKGRREFYRYTPKENPAMKVFPSQSGLNVERNLSNQSHVVLLAVPLNISGKFTCEISVEAPSFQTAMVSGEMEVVELPEEQATVTGIQPRYRIGDLVDGNCSIKYSKPAANLTWTINGIVVPPHHIKTYQIEKYEENNLESVMSAVHFMVTTQHFIKGQMRLKCTASIFDIFKEEIESVIEEDRPRIMASGQSYPTDHGYGTHSDADGYEHNESYLTYFSAPKSSASSTADFIVSKVIKQKCLKSFQLLTSFIANKTKYILTMAIINNFKSSFALSDFIKIEITYYNALQYIMIGFIMTSLVIFLVKAVWQKNLQNLLKKCLQNKMTQHQQLAHNFIEAFQQFTQKKKEIFIAINLWRGTQYRNKKEQQEENENCYQNADDNVCRAKCNGRRQHNQPTNGKKNCSLSNVNVFNKIVSLNDTNIIVIYNNTSNKNSAAIKATIDCQHHMSQTLALSTFPPSSCALIHSPPSSSFALSFLYSSASTSSLSSSSSSSSSSLPFSSIERSNRKTYAHDSFSLYAVDASKSNNAKYMSKDQTLLMTLTATAANSFVVFIVFGTLATSNSLYKTPSAFAPITATQLRRALVLGPKLLQTSVHPSLAIDDEQNSLPSPIFFRNNYLMAFIAELLLHQC